VALHFSITFTTLKKKSQKMTTRLLNRVASRTKPLSLYKKALTPIIKRAESTIPYNNAKVSEKKAIDCFRTAI
jgi:hypothetical protein